MKVRLVALALSLALAPAGDAAARAQDDGGGFSFEIVEAEVKTEDQAAYDECRRLLNSEQYPSALECYDALVTKEGMDKFLDDAEYDSAKALYRMGLYHAALSRYAAILERGTKHKYYENSREWLFFIARRLEDRTAAVELIATYTKPEELPAKFKNEFNYQLARFFFDLAVTQGAQGVVEETAEEPATPDGAEGGQEGGGESEGGDEFEFDAIDVDKDTGKKPDDGKKGDGKKDDGKKGDKPAKEEKKEGDDFNFDEGDFDFSGDDLGGGDDDGFDFSFDESDSKKKKKRSKKRKSSGKKGSDAADAASEETTDDNSPDESGFDLNFGGEPSAGEGGETGDAGAGAEDAAQGAPSGPPEDPDASLKRALAYIEQVDETFPSYAKAVYLRGLIHFALGSFEPAVDSFRQVVRMTNPKGGEVENPKLREMAFFSLARIHYQFEQFRYAIFYYERIDRDSEAWLDALFEASWAHFRLGEYEKALGNLVTIQSPFFVNEYYPESHILKAITFYENCRYPEATAFLDEFKAKYDGVVAELDRLLVGGKSPELLYEELRELQAKVDAGKDDSARSLAITARLLRIALKDKRLAAYAAAIDEVERELVALKALPPPYGGTEGHGILVTQVEGRRGALVKATGTLLQIKLAQERQFLKDLQAKLIRIQFEIAKQQKEGLEAELRGESQAVALSDYNFTTATDDERVFWPFEGEYWRDELGTYEYTLTRGCRPPEQ